MSAPPSPPGRLLERNSTQPSWVSHTGRSSFALLMFATGTPVPNDPLLPARVETRMSVPQSLPRPVSSGRPSHRTRRFPPSGVAHRVSNEVYGAPPLGSLHQATP